MKRVEFSKEKSIQLKKDRGVSLEEVAKIIKKGGIVGVVAHPNKKKYPKQQLFLVNIKSYIYIVPFVEDEKKIFLKTIFASRKHTKEYIKK